MKKLLLIPLVLAGCGSTSSPSPSYVHANPPPVQLVLDAKVQQMSRNEVIHASHECQENGLRAVPIISKRMVSGMMSDIIIDVQCMPRYNKFPY
jgi:hypothetical protein